MKEEDILYKLLNWGSSDVPKLLKYLNACEKLRIDMDQLHDAIDGLEMNKIDMNTWFYAAIDTLFHNIVSHLQSDYELTDDEISYIHRMEDNFGPYINYLDSWFDNIFDEIDFESDTPIYDQAYDLVAKASKNG